MSKTNAVLLNLLSISELPAAATQIIKSSPNSRIFLFYGEMGAGKTTLIQALCRQLGVNEAATSPTFSIVNEYRARADVIYHFDFYRLKNQSEALDMGYEEYFYSGAYCFIEWPEKIAGLLPEHYVRLKITVTGPGSREISIENI